MERIKRKDHEKERKGQGKDDWQYWAALIFCFFIPPWDIFVYSWVLFVWYLLHFGNRPTNTGGRSNQEGALSLMKFKILFLIHLSLSQLDRHQKLNTTIIFKICFRILKYKFGLKFLNLTFLAQTDCLFAIPSKLQSWLFLLFPIIWEWRKQWEIYCSGSQNTDMKYRKGRVVQ